MPTIVLLIFTFLSCDDYYKLISKHKAELSEIKTKAEDSAQIQKTHYPDYSPEFSKLYSNLRSKHDGVITFLVSTLDKKKTYSIDEFNTEYNGRISSVRKELNIISNSIKAYNKKREEGISAKGIAAVIPIIVAAIGAADKAYDLYIKFKKKHEEVKKNYIADLESLKITEYQKIKVTEEVDKKQRE